MPLSNTTSRAFHDHLADAIAINIERKNLYAKMTGNKSLWVSWPLIWSEKATLVIAFFIDRKAQKFQKMGIPIIANDFVPMHPLPSHDTPPKYLLGADKPTLNAVLTTLNMYQKALKACLNKSDFLEAARISYDTLQNIKQAENKHQCHFAMTRHLIESIGFAAHHALEYEKSSHGETTSLSKTFLRIQSLGISSGLWLDKQAQPIHQMGVGIIINDVPYIPFEDEFKSRK